MLVLKLALMSLAMWNNGHGDGGARTDLPPTADSALSVAQVDDLATSQLPKEAVDCVTAM